MKSHSIKASIVISFLTLCEFAFAGVGVRLYVKNSTGADLSSVGACIGDVDPGAVCIYDSFTVRAGDEVQIAYTELDVNKTFDMPFAIADDTSHYICTTRIIGQTNNSSYDPKVYSTINAITQPIKGKDITHGCRRFGDLIDINKNKVGVHIEILPVTMALTPAMAPLTPAKTQPLESLTPPLTKPLTPISPASLQPFRGIVALAPEEYIKTDNALKYESVPESEYFHTYSVTCIDGRNMVFKRKGTFSWENEKEGISFTIKGSDGSGTPTLEELRMKIGIPYCMPRVPGPVEELYYMKSSLLTKGTRGYIYSVTCLDSKIMPTTFHADYTNETSWTNGIVTFPLPGYDSERMDDYWKYLRYYVGERYCGNLPEPFSNPNPSNHKVLSYVRSSKLDKTNANTTYTVACASGSISSFAYDAVREVYSSGTQAYHVKKQYKDNQDYLNLSIAGRYCQASGKLDTRKNVGVMRAGIGEDGFTGLARIYVVICKNPMPSAIETLFWRKDSSEASWTNVLKTYNLSQSAVTLFKNGSDKDRYKVILENVATPYCDGR